MYLQSLHNKIKKYSALKLILLSVVALYAIQIIVTPLYQLYPIEEKSNDVFFQTNTFSQFMYVFWSGGIKAPVIETIIFQTFIIRLILVWSKIFKKDEGLIIYIIAIVLSALAFGFVHAGYGSVIKIINCFFIGLVLAYLYIIMYLTNRKASLSVICVHAIWNISTIIVNYMASM